MAKPDGLRSTQESSRDSGEANASVATRVGKVCHRIRQACLRAGRDPSEVTLVAATKTRTPGEILAALCSGVRDFGENRAEEALPKIQALERMACEENLQQPRWHMIGHVQRRKAKLVVGQYELLHSLDTVRLGERLNRVAQELQASVDVLLEINTSDEPSKYGFAGPGPEGTPSPSFLEAMDHLLALQNVRIHGLMTMAPIVDIPEKARPFFRRLRLMRDWLQAHYPEADWHHLSMGMTDDFEVAIEEGATLVRIGRAIFGPRLDR